MILSNGNITGARDAIRTQALQSFEFFANSVLSLRLSEPLCSVVQHAEESHQALCIETARPAAFCNALHIWLTSKGYAVCSDDRLPDQHEVLEWLDLFSEVEKNGVDVQIYERNGLTYVVFY
jgi:hypothetical protein